MNRLAITFTLYLVFACTSPLVSQELSVVETTDTVQLVKGSQPIFQYNKKPTAQAASAKPVYSRSGYIHPLYSPSGKVVTGDYAPDHAHQHGLFFAWTKSKFRGEATEFWNQAREQGDVRYSRYLGSETSDATASLGFEQIFTSGKDSDEAILTEVWQIEVPKVKAPGCFVFDLTSTQSCATADPLEILQHHYGGMAIRGSSDWLSQDEAGQEKPEGRMLTSRGKTRLDGNHSRPDWVAMYGPVDGHTCGVVVMSHPSNFRSPQWVRLHPSKPYFVFAPMVEAPFTIEPDQPYVSRFRYLTFDGEPDIESIKSLWNDFAKS